MAKKVTIPVEVQGGEKSQEELAQLKGKLEELAGAQGGSAAKSEKAADQNKKAARSILDVDDAAKTAATSILNRMNPALGGAVELVTNLAKGAGSMSLSLLGFVGVGFAIEGISALFRSMSEQAEKAAEAIRRAKEERRAMEREAIKGQVGLADQLAGAGVFGAAGAASADARAIADSLGVERSLAEFGAVARTLRPELTNEQVRDLLAGFVAGGRQGGFSGDSRQNRRMIDRLLRRGATPDARAALSGRIADVGLAAAGDWPRGAPTAAAGSIDAIASEVFSQFPNLTEAEREEVERMLRAYPSIATGRVSPADLLDLVVRRVKPGMVAVNYRERYGRAHPTEEERREVLGGIGVDQRSLGELLALVERVASQMHAVAGGAAGARPIVIYNTTNNVGTAVQDLDVFKRPPSPDYMELQP